MEKNNGSYYVYPFTQPISLAAGQTLQDSIVINTQNFLMKKISTKATGDFLLQITDNNNKNFFNKPVLASLLFSDAGKNNRALVRSRLLRAKQTITITITDVSGAANSVYIALEGIEI